MKIKIHNIAILGGTGFVGWRLVRRLAESGYSIRVLTRRRERHRELLVMPRLTLVEADIHDPHALQEQLAGCDAVINLVGILNEKGRDGAGFRRVHVELPRKIAAACSALGIRRLLHMSALNADAHAGASLYLSSKGEGEDLVHDTAGLDVTSFRPSVIFGPGDSFFNRFAKLLRVSPIIFPLACPKARFAPVYVNDVAQAFSQALIESNSFGRRYDLCGPNIYTLQELVEYTAQVTGHSRRIIGLSDGFSRWQARLLEWLPGKPFSLDNYRSLQIDSVCHDGFPAFLNQEPASVEAVAPSYLVPRHARARYQRFRRHAGRD